jgi:hypothetical protein
MLCRVLPAIVVVTLLASASLRTLTAAEPAAEAPSPEQVKFFETHIRPLLANRCFKCHGEQKQSGALRLDGLNTMLAGGDSGTAIVPGKPDESLLVEAVRYESYEMPPDGQLPDEEIDLLVRWVAMGAPWPTSDRNVAVPTSGKITDEDRQYWAFQPPAVVEVPSAPDSGWGTNEIDAFVWRKLVDNNLRPSPPADRLTLVRRVYQGLIGLPPTPEQMDAFLSDDSPRAYEGLVDQLLESARHGEHWATFWLDLVRYAESDGFRADYYRPDAWRYRDYVIDAFNSDKPYDRFVMEQIAGDEFFAGDPQALAATGYLRHGIYEYNQRDAVTQWHDMLNDITDTTAEAFLGLGMGCARCHDHKFDPILQKDYYRLQAFFAGIAFRDDVPLATPQQIADYQQQLAVWEQQTAEVRAELEALDKPKLDKLAEAQIQMFPQETQDIMTKASADRTPYEKQIAYLVELQVLDRQKQLEKEFQGEEKERWEALKQQLAKFEDSKPKPLPSGQTASDIDETAAVVHIPGKERLGEVAPGFLSVLDESPAEFTPLPTSPQTTGRRAALAQWLVQPDNPLTARVIVNRVWQQHFGTGLVATVNDFGHLGETPSHPELLDWLAVSFVENGWSLKWLHRTIVTSQTWRQASVVEPSAQALRVDPGNRLLWRQNVHRLTAEQIRDGLLLVSGELKHAVGGPSEDAASSKRRSVYTKLRRNSRDPLLDVFDLPDRITPAGSRNVTTTPAQALLMINSDLILSQASAFASRLEHELPGGGESQLRLAYRLAYGRDPSEQELQRPTAILGDETAARSETEGARHFSQMPQTGLTAAVIDPDDDQSLLKAGGDQPAPGSDFTVEAIVLLKSLYPDASVRTIASQWSGDTSEPGWSLGVTSTKSAYRPRNLILQLVGKTAGDKKEYEVIPSDIHLDLDQPYYVAVAVDVDQTETVGVRFYVRRLGGVEEATQSVQVPHKVTGAYAGERAFAIGGRDGSKRHRWDGLIDQVRVTGRALDEKELLLSGTDRPEGILGWWTFDAADALLAEQSGEGVPLVRTSATAQLPPRLVDFCHVLLNSNEFLYVD